MKPKKKFNDNLLKYRHEIGALTGIDAIRKKKSGSKTINLSRKEKRKLERRLKHAKNNAFHTKQAEMPSLESLIESKRKKKPAKKEATSKPEKKKSKKLEKKESVRKVEQFKYEDERDDVEIRKLEKLLHIKKDAKNYKRSFYDDGLDTILDFCDSEKRREIVKKETGSESAWLEMEESEADEDDDRPEVVEKETKKKDDEKVARKNGKKEIEDEEEGEEEDDNDDELNEEDFDEEEMDEDGFEDDEDEDESDDPSENDESEEENPRKKKVRFEDDDADNDKNEYKEDIYGRLIGKNGEIIDQKRDSSKILTNKVKELDEKLKEKSKEIHEKLNKQLKGLLNRLSTANMHSILNQISQLFYSNTYSRYDLIDCLYKLMQNSILNKLNLTPERLVCEHAALVCVLSANVGIELGATFIQKLICLFNDEFKVQNMSIENKYLDNLSIFLCCLYNFKLFSSVLAFNLINEKILNEIESANVDNLEKLVELLLIFLRRIGFQLRKDNAVQLKEFILKSKEIIHKLTSDNTKFGDGLNARLRFMIESIQAIKNNDIRKLDGYDPELYEQVSKHIKPLYGTKTTSSDVQMHVTYDDLVNADENGKWWIVGSAWSQTSLSNKNKKSDDPTNTGPGGFSQKILDLAKKQHMNTDLRRTIFCIIVSAEDFSDAFYKLMKLSLKKQQEREIVYVIVHCTLNEKHYNPYYSFLMQKFCEYDRRFKMTLQFHTWDKYKQITTMTAQQITNFGLFYSYLIGIRAMPLTVLKNVSFGEMDKSMLLYLRTLFIDLFEKQSDEDIGEIFLRVCTTNKLKQLRNALKLFMSHFMAGDKGKAVELSEKLINKCDLVQKFLTRSVE